MNRKDLVKAVAATTDLTEKDVGKTINAVFECIADALQSGEPVRLSGFGVFSVADRPARKARNPQTGEPVEIPPSKGVKLKVAQALKAALNT